MSKKGQDTWVFATKNKDKDMSTFVTSAKMPPLGECL